MSLNHTGRSIIITVFLTLSTAAVIFYGAFHVPLKQERERVTECVEQLAEYANSLNPRLDYGVAEYRYDPASDRCLFRSNFVADTEEGYYFEKFIVDAFTGETVARFAELNGVSVADDLTAFSAEVDRLFPR